MFAETRNSYTRRVASQRHVYSIGYEQRTADALVKTLASVGVQVLVDVRMTPLSRRPGFSRTSLAGALTRQGIAYQHEPLLGNPPENREPFRTGNVTVGRRRFQRRLSNGSSDALAALSALAARKAVAVMCVEHEEDRCHRQVILEALTAENPRLAVTRL
jgi:uncharacterized protein (DUF488 family)